MLSKRENYFLFFRIYGGSDIILRRLSARSCVFTPPSLSLALFPRSLASSLMFARVHETRVLFPSVNNDRAHFVCTQEIIRKSSSHCIFPRDLSVPRRVIRTLREIRAICATIFLRDGKILKFLSACCVFCFRKDFWTFLCNPIKQVRRDAKITLFYVIFSLDIKTDRSVVTISQTNYFFSPLSDVLLLTITKLSYIKQFLLLVNLNSQEIDFSRCFYRKFISAINVNLYGDKFRRTYKKCLIKNVSIRLTHLHYFEINVDLAWFFFPRRFFRIALEW